MKKRLAIFSTGGIGAGTFSQGLPVLGTIVESLSVRFDVTFYSLNPIDPEFQPKGYTIRSPPARLAAIRIKGLRWLVLAWCFLVDNLKAPYQVTLSFWGYPMGIVVVGLSKLTGIRSVVILLGAETADLPAIHYGHMRRRVTRRLVMWTCAQASALIAVAKSQLDVLRSHDLDRRDGHVVPLGAEVDRFVFEDKPLGVPLRIVHVANLTEVKDQKTLLAAFALLREETDATLRIVGQDFMNGEIHTLARGLGLSDDVEFIGQVPFATMPAQYHWADMFLLTSLSEGQNRSLTEAALCGVLQVSTPVGHIKDLGTDVAVIVNPGDPRDIADKIRGIMRDRTEWKRKVANARNWATAHSIDWTTARLAGIIEEQAR